jgi:hypothetical protein
MEWDGKENENERSMVFRPGIHRYPIVYNLYLLSHVVASLRTSAPSATH